MKTLHVLFASMLGLLLSLQAQAVSLIDFTDAGIVAAAGDIEDTSVAASEFVIPIIVAIVAITVGIKLFKRFTGKI